jgi:hypothetical protein
MKEMRASIKTALLVLLAVSSGAVFVRADSYSWQNFQSDIAGVAAHTDSNLVNPWGMAASSGEQFGWPTTGPGRRRFIARPGPRIH